MPSIRTRLLSVLVFLAAGCSAAQAQSTDGWRYTAIVYGYFPSLGGSSSYPARTGGSSVDVTTDQILDSLKFTFMGTLEATNGRWGAFTDFIYMDLGAGKSRTRDLSIGGMPLPADVTANLTLDVKGTVWTAAGTWRVANEPALVVDLLGGLRYFDYRQTLGWEFSADLGPDAPERSGNSQVHGKNWNGIVGAKGRFAFGDRHEWFVPWYLDVGTGDADLTWQAMAGLGYSFGWGDVLAGYRYLDYDFKSGQKINDVNFSGPMVGVSFRW